MKLIPKVPAWVRESPVLPWVFLFFAINLAVTQYGGTNALARTASLRAITEGHTLSIDNYKDWTIDWAHAPDGHYYSNKAPGASFLALPIFAVTELFSLPLAAGKLDEKGRAPQPGYFAHIFLIFFLQLFPCAWLVLGITRGFRERGLPDSAAHFFALAVFFGNTAAIYMNSNFGHGLASLLFLAAFAQWLQRRYLFTGLLLSWSLLTDYGVAFTLPFVLGATLLRERDPMSLVRIGIGAMPGALVWIFYHTAAFGSPFATGILYANPEQLTSLGPEERYQLSGTFSPFPSFRLVGLLLFGTSRGLLFTQPWIFACFALPFLKGKALPKGGALLVAGSLLGLLWMNGGFGGWQGGWCLGPRYLSSVFLAAALVIALAWEQFPRNARLALWAFLAVALLFRVLVFPFSSLAPDENLWLYHLAEAQAPSHRGTTLLRYAIAVILSGLCVLWVWKRAGFPRKISL